MIDVDVIDADREVADLDLAGRGVGQRLGFESEHLWRAKFGKLEGFSLDRHAALQGISRNLLDFSASVEKPLRKPIFQKWKANGLE
ncbi:hypothetical protein D9M70_481410 [compost metagenome]